MKILAVNSSPRNDRHSKTKMMLNALVEGMRGAGAEVTVVDLRKKRVKNCTGCMTAGPGRPASAPSATT